MKDYSVTLIIKFLSKHPNSNIQIISNNLKISRDTVKSVLDSLHKNKIVILNENNNLKTYNLSNIFSHNSIYFNLPISKRNKNIINYLFMTIKKYWLKHNSGYPPKTHMQKIIFDINKTHNLNLPIGWYKYGAISVVPYNKHTTYTYDINLVKKEFNKYIDSVDKEIENIVKDVSILSLHDIKKRQYELENNELYLNSLKINDILYKDDKLSLVDSNNIKNISRKIIRETMYIDDGLNDFANKFYETIVGISLIYKNNTNFSEINLRKDISNIFDSFWNILSLYNFKKTLDKFYTKEQLDNAFNIKIEYTKDYFLEMYSEFQDKYVVKDMYANDPLIIDLINKLDIN